MNTLPHWIFVSLERYWRKQAHFLDFEHFVVLYVQQMIIQQRYWFSILANHSQKRKRYFVRGL